MIPYQNNALPKTPVFDLPCKTLCQLLLDSKSIHYRVNSPAHLVSCYHQSLLMQFVCHPKMVYVKGSFSVQLLKVVVSVPPILQVHSVHLLRNMITGDERQSNEDTMLFQALGLSGLTYRQSDRASLCM